MKLAMLTGSQFAGCALGALKFHFWQADRGPDTEFIKEFIKGLSLLTKLALN